MEKFSNCCGAKVNEVQERCVRCGEHCDIETFLDERVEVLHKRVDRSLVIIRQEILYLETLLGQLKCTHQTEK